MSHEATNWAFKQRGLGPSAKLVLMYLADHHNPSYGCFPMQVTLAHECEMSRSSINNQLAKLEDMGLIRRVRQIDDRTGKQLATRYILGFEKEFAQVPCPDVGHGETGTEEEHEGDPCPDTGHGSVSKISTSPCPNSGPSRVQNLDTNPVREPLKEPVTRVPAREGDFSFDDFWEVYPRPVERAAAERAWRDAIKRGADPAALVAAAEALANEDVEERFRKKPANWLRDGGWADGGAPGATCASGRSGAPPATLQERAAFWAAKIRAGVFVAPSAIGGELARAMIEGGHVDRADLRKIGVHA
ncbi:helix-turn-helix domain-containing protein [Meridianimarinicoccus sp. RP-17]|uniref:helix-turn-helix domain-containing protein n=1 Tax=Meridianimarinicoccus zhengii TaxID=2056810 RepID=UPI000DABBC21|nr:helix-turn-helix domain-containing protein [Phycocomes zhengii]